MHYEINVAMHGKHFFATQAKSLRDVTDAMDAMKVMVVKFPKTEGYTVTLTKHVSSSVEVFEVSE